MARREPNLHLIHGNDAEAVANARYELQTRLLPGGEADGEITDIRPPGNQPLKLEKAFSLIVGELSTVSLIPDAKRVVVVWQLHDFRDDRRGSARAAKKAKKTAKSDMTAELESYVVRSLLNSEHSLIFVFDEDDEKGRRVSKTSAIYQMVRKHGAIQEFSEKRIDWQLDDALLNGNLDEAVRLIREWTDRGGNAPFRLVTTLNTFLQLLLQARLELEARRDGIPSKGLFGGPVRPGLESVPDFKAKRVRALSSSVSLERIRRALQGLNDAQRSFFPTGRELVVHNAVEQVEVMLAELLGGRAAAARR